MNLLRRAVRLALFVPWFLFQLVVANAVVAWEVVTPRRRMRPGIIEVPVQSRSDLEITMLGNLISLTPGTLTVEVAPERNVIYVHALHIKTPDDIRRQVGRLEFRLLGVLR